MAAPVSTVVRGADDLWGWARELWDPAMGLVANPPGGYVELGPFAGRHLIRESAWFALDALGHGDRDTAVVALRSVLGRQYDRPGEAWHGTFPIFEHDPEPGDDAIMWLSYDPNWRQFVGVTLAVIVSQYHDVLPAEVAADCETAIRRCVAGEPVGRIAPSYTNPALMHAWLADWVGRRFQEPAVAAQGQSLAASVMALFEATGTVGEFNSPTYDGVNLLAATLWAGAEEPLRSWGRRLLASLFDSLAFMWHPRLANLCGPYSRAYGMDLGARITLYGVWRLVARGDPTALPPLSGRVEHSHDLFFAPLVDRAVAGLPQPFPDDNQSFPRQRSFVLDSGRRAEAFLDHDVMMGAGQGGREGLVWDQYVPGTMHWRRRDGGLGWVRVHASETIPVDCHLAGAGPDRPDRLLVVPLGSDEVTITTNAAVERVGSRTLTLDGRVRLMGGARPAVDPTRDGSRIAATAGAAGAVVVAVEKSD